MRFWHMLNESQSKTLPIEHAIFIGFLILRGPQRATANMDILMAEKFKASSTIGIQYIELIQPGIDFGHCELETYSEEPIF
jgi:hypothetical protein